MKDNWNSKIYEDNARFVTDLGMPVVELLNPKPGESILDIGCGDGILTKKLEDLECQVVGVDSSKDFVESAKKLGLEVYHCNAYDIEFENQFDAVFSNAALHWMKNADLVIANAYRALKSGGRFVAECGGLKCVDTIKSALIESLNQRGLDGEMANPWYFPSDDDYRSRLENAGFEVNYIALIPRPTPLPGDVMGWLKTFSFSFLEVLPESEHQVFLEEVREKIKPKLCDDKGLWTADYIRLRFEAYKK